MTPRSNAGRLFLLFFASIGIPLSVITLKAVGDRINAAIANVIRGFERKLLKREAQNIKLKQMVVAALLMILELFIGGLMYNVTEEWNYISSVYYCFVVFSTIGFGDLVPNQGRAPSNNFEMFMMLMRSAVLILGLATLSSLLSAAVQGMDEFNVAFPFCKGRRVIRPVDDTDAESNTAKRCDDVPRNEERSQNNLVLSSRSLDDREEATDQIEPTSLFARRVGFENASLDNAVKPNNLQSARQVENTWSGRGRHVLSPVARALLSGAFPCGPLETGDPLLFKENHVNAILQGERYFGPALKLPPIQRRHSNIEVPHVREHIHSNHSPARNEEYELTTPVVSERGTRINVVGRLPVLTAEIPYQMPHGRLFATTDAAKDVPSSQTSSYVTLNPVMGNTQQDQRDAIASSHIKAVSHIQGAAASSISGAASHISEAASHIPGAASHIPGAASHIPGTASLKPGIAPQNNISGIGSRKALPITPGGSQGDSILSPDTTFITGTAVPDVKIEPPSDAADTSLGSLPYDQPIANNAHVTPYTGHGQLKVVPLK